MLSHLLEPGVRVSTLTLAANTPALQFLPAGTGPHPVALLAHGVTASKETLFRFSEALAAAGFLCFSVDLPGHGHSAQRFDPAANARTLGDVAHSIGSVDVFVGHSMGAAAGARAVRDGGLKPRLFIAVGALTDLGATGPPLLLLAGRFEEAVRPDWLRERTDARLVLSPWSDHALELVDPLLVDAAVTASCAAVGKDPPPRAPMRWLLRLAGVVIGLMGAVGLAFSLPDLFPALAAFRGVAIALTFIAAVAATSGTWIGAAPVLCRFPQQIVLMITIFLLLVGLGKLGIPRWSLAALAAVGALGCVFIGAYFFALIALLGALVLLAGALVGALAARPGSRVQGHMAMGIFVGYAIGQWCPLIV